MKTFRLKDLSRAVLSSRESTTRRSQRKTKAYCNRKTGKLLTCGWRKPLNSLSSIFHPSSLRRAFSLIELLVVIVIIGVIAAIAIPSIANMKSAMATSSAVNTVASTIKAARGLAGRQKGNFTVVGANYSGCAALFTPSGKVRFVVNDDLARTVYGGDNVYLELLHNKDAAAFATDQINAYKDIPGVDDVTLPSTAGVVGIYYENDGVHYLAPPFALHFTASGQLQTSHVGTTGTAPTNLWGFVFYNSKGISNYTFDLSSSYRPSNYDYTNWSSAQAIENYGVSAPLNPITNELKLPFDRIEAVIGVIVYNKQDFKNAGLLPTDFNRRNNYVKADKWLAKNGHPILINRATGTIARGVVTAKGGG